MSCNNVLHNNEEGNFDIRGYNSLARMVYDRMNERGYSPEYLEDEVLDFECMIDGMRFYFCFNDAFINDSIAIFSYGVEIPLKEELSNLEYDMLYKLYESEEVVFESFHVEGKTAWLLTVLSEDFADGGLADEILDQLELKGGFVDALKARLDVKEDV